MGMDEKSTIHEPWAQPITNFETGK